MQYLAPSQRVLAVSMHLASSHMVFDVLGVTFRTGLDNSYNATSGAMGTTSFPRRLARICVVICNGVDGATHTARRLRGRHTLVWSGMVVLDDEGGAAMVGAILNQWSAEAGRSAERSDEPIAASCFDDLLFDKIATGSLRLAIKCPNPINPAV